VKIMIESTGKRAVVDGISCHFWEGVTESGARCVVFVHRIAVERGADLSEFQRELAETPQPGEVEIDGLRQDWG
jgi:hypothetical protein